MWIGAVWLGLSSPNEAYAQPTYILRLSATLGNEDAMMYLAERYRMGDSLNNTVVNHDSANFYLREAAKKGNADACYLLGVAYVRGVGSVKSPKKGAYWLEQAAQKKHQAALNFLSDFYAHPQPHTFSSPEEALVPDPKVAFKYAERGAKTRNEKAMLYTAYAYLKGNGVPQNDTLGLAWLDSICIYFNSPEAQLALGDLYFYGKTTLGVNPEKAEYYYHKVAYNQRADLDTRTAGKIGLYYAPLLKRQVLNMLLLLPFPKLDHAPQLFYRP